MKKVGISRLKKNDNDLTTFCKSCKNCFYAVTLFFTKYILELLLSNVLQSISWL